MGPDTPPEPLAGDPQVIGQNEIFGHPGPFPGPTGARVFRVQHTNQKTQDQPGVRGRPHPECGMPGCTGASDKLPRFKRRGGAKKRTVNVMGGGKARGWPAQPGGIEATLGGEHGPMGRGGRWQVGPKRGAKLDNHVEGNHFAPDTPIQADWPMRHHKGKPRGDR